MSGGAQPIGLDVFPRMDRLRAEEGFREQFPLVVARHDPKAPDATREVVRPQGLHASDDREVFRGPKVDDVIARFENGAFGNDQFFTSSELIGVFPCRTNDERVRSAARPTHEVDVPGRHARKERVVKGHGGEALFQGEVPHGLVAFHVQDRFGEEKPHRPVLGEDRECRPEDPREGVFRRRAVLEFLALFVLFSLLAPQGGFVTT